MQIQRFRCRVYDRPAKHWICFGLAQLHTSQQFGTRSLIIVVNAWLIKGHFIPSPSLFELMLISKLVSSCHESSRIVVLWEFWIKPIFDSTLYPILFRGNRIIPNLLKATSLMLCFIVLHSWHSIAIQSDSLNQILETWKHTLNSLSSMGFKKTTWLCFQKEQANLAGQLYCSKLIPPDPLIDWPHPTIALNAVVDCFYSLNFYVSIPVKWLSFHEECNIFSYSN